MARTPNFSHEADLDHDKLVTRLHYTALTGVWRWLERPREDFHDYGACFSWNHTFAGREAGTMVYGGAISINLFKKVYKAERLAVFYMEQRWPKTVTFKGGFKNDLRYRNLVVTFDEEVQATPEDRAQRQRLEETLDICNTRPRYRPRRLRNVHWGDELDQTLAHLTNAPSREG